jgi:hypothetical protein
VTIEKGVDPMRSVRIASPFIVFAAVISCSGSSESTGSTSSGLITGPIDLRVIEVVDGDETPPGTTATAIVVTIDRVDAKLESDEDDWRTLSMATKTVDLLSLPTGGFVSLGVAQLPAAGLERLRLFVSPAGPNYVVTADGQTHTLVVPNDEIAVVGDFDAEACAAGSIGLAFAGRKSIEAHALADGTTEGVLRPVVRLQEVEAPVQPCEGDGRGDHGHKDHVTHP